MMACCDLRMRAAATIFMALVICSVDLTDLILRRISRSDAISDSHRGFLVPEIVVDSLFDGELGVQLERARGRARVAEGLVLVERVRVLEIVGLEPRAQG